MADQLDSAKQFLKKGLDPSLFAATKEQPLRVKKEQTVLRIGIPRETTFQESRVPLTPAAVGSLVAAGHEVMVEHKAGASANYMDDEYTRAGAFIAYSPAEVFSKADVIVKIAPLNTEELKLLKPKQVIISAVHIGGLKPDYLKALMAKSVTAIGFEFMQDPDGTYPILKLMSEIAGISAIHIASALLAAPQSGSGILLGGVTGVPPAVVTIIGAGTVGYHASKTAIGLGATVKVIDEEVYKLRRLEEQLGQKVHTAVAQPHYIAEAVESADVLIGAAYKAGLKAPCVVTEEMVSSMREGSVIVDVAIDQGGCIETSRLTSYDQPTYVLHGVTHFCIPNIAARVARTASASISNVLGALLLRIGEHGGIRSLMAQSPNFKRGLYVYHRHITQRHIASLFNLDFMDIDLLYAAEL